MSLSEKKKSLPIKIQHNFPQWVLLQEDVKEKIQSAKKRLKKFKIKVPSGSETEYIDGLGRGVMEMFSHIDKIFLEEFGEELL